MLSETYFNQNQLKFSYLLLQTYILLLSSLVNSYMIKNIKKFGLQVGFPTVRLCLTHFSWETPKKVTGKRCRPRLDAAQCGV